MRRGIWIVAVLVASLAAGAFVAAGDPRTKRVCFDVLVQEPQADVWGPPILRGGGDPSTGGGGRDGAGGSCGASSCSIGCAKGPCSAGPCPSGSRAACDCTPEGYPVCSCWPC